MNEKSSRFEFNDRGEYSLRQVLKQKKTEKPQPKKATSQFTLNMLLNASIKRAPKKNQARKSYKWNFLSKLSSHHAIYDYSFLKIYANHLSCLTIAEDTFVRLFWPDRARKISYTEIANTCASLANRKQAVLFMAQLENIGLIKKKKTVHKEVYCGKNYYSLTSQGQKILKKIVNKAFKGVQQGKAWGLLPIEIRAGNPRLENNSNSFDKKTINFLNHISNTPFGDIKNAKKVPKGTQNFSIERIKKLQIAKNFVKNPFAYPPNSGFAGSEEEYHGFLESRLAQLETEQPKVNTAIRETLANHGLERHLLTLNNASKLNSQPLGKIKKACKLYKAKLKKNCKIKNFWGFFFHVLEGESVDSFHVMRAKQLIDAAKGNVAVAVKRGADSQDVADQLQALEKQTGVQVDALTLSRWLTLYGLQKILIGLRGCLFRLKKAPSKTWIGLANFYFKKFVTTQELHNAFFKKKADEADDAFSIWENNNNPNYREELLKRERAQERAFQRFSPSERFA